MQNCGQSGSFQRQCKNSKKAALFCHICEDKFHLNRECRKRNVGTVNRKPSEEEEEILFCLGSGVTVHCVGNQKHLQNIHELEPFTMIDSFGKKDKGNLVGEVRGYLANHKAVVEYYYVNN